MYSDGRAITAYVVRILRRKNPTSAATFFQYNSIFSKWIKPLAG